MVTSDVTDSSFIASWTAAPGDVQSYKVNWQSQFTGESGQTTVPGQMTSVELQPLSPETLYRVSVVAVYRHKESEPLSGLETTDGKKHWER